MAAWWPRRPTTGWSGAGPFPLPALSTVGRGAGIGGGSPSISAPPPPPICQCLPSPPRRAPIEAGQVASHPRAGASRAILHLPEPLSPAGQRGTRRPGWATPHPPHAVALAAGGLRGGRMGSLATQGGGGSPQRVCAAAGPCVASRPADGGRGRQRDGRRRHPAATAVAVVTTVAVATALPPPSLRTAACRQRPSAWPRRATLLLGRPACRGSAVAGTPARDAPARPPPLSLQPRGLSRSPRTS